jgi:hypothetical protein
LGTMFTSLNDRLVFLSRVLVWNVRRHPRGSPTRDSHAHLEDLSPPHATILPRLLGESSCDLDLETLTLGTPSHRAVHTCKLHVLASLIRYACIYGSTEMTTLLFASENKIRMLLWGVPSTGAKQKNVNPN